MHDEHPLDHVQSATDCSPGGCRCCTARSAALEATLWDVAPEWRSPLSPGILPDNIALSMGERSFRVDLWREWPRMLAGLRRVGPVLTMTRNRSVALGRWGRYPELEWSADGLQAMDDEGHFDFDLRHWAQGYARHQRGPEGNLFAAEFSDHAGECFHRVSLVAESSLEAFSEWTRVHQALPGVLSAAAVDDDGGLAREPVGDGAWIEMGCSAVERLLQEFLEREMSMRVIVGGSGAVQAESFTPVKLSRDEGWTYCHGENTALHFQPERFARVRLHDLAPGGAECWTLRAYDAEGTLLLMLLPAGRDRLPLWNLLLQQLA